jgi:hypothetical protein
VLKHHSDAAVLRAKMNAGARIGEYLITVTNAAPDGSDGACDCGKCEALART